MSLNSIKAIHAAAARWLPAFAVSCLLTGHVMAAAADGASDEASTDVAARLAALEAQVNSLSNTMATKRELGLPVHGFSDVDFVHDTQHANGTQGGFVLGNFDLYMTPSLGGRMRSLVELNFEYGESGSLSTDLERLEYGYTFSDAFTLWFGRFHTPYGYWNTAFHHGTQMQLSARRPQFVDFEDSGGILPAHSNGLNAEGKWRAGQGKLSYDLYIANGDRILDGTLDFNAVKDNDNNKLVGGKLQYAFGGNADGLVIGVHAFSEQVSSYTGTTLLHSVTVNMLGAFAVLETDSWQAMMEYYHFNNHDDSGTAGSHSSWAGYAQLGYRINTLTPYVRYEDTVLDQADNYFADQESGRSYKREVAGIRYDMNAHVSLKGEWNHTKDELRAGDTVPADWDKLVLQLGVAF